MLGRGSFLLRVARNRLYRLQDGQAILALENAPKAKVTFKESSNADDVGHG
jgi:hypothetical protein